MTTYTPYDAEYNALNRLLHSGVAYKAKAFAEQQERLDLVRLRREGYLRALTDLTPSAYAKATVDKLLAAAKAVAENLEAAQGQWAAVTKIYSPEWICPLKDGANHLRAAIAAAEKRNT